MNRPNSAPRMTSTTSKQPQAIDLAPAQSHQKPQLPTASFVRGSDRIPRQDAYADSKERVALGGQWWDGTPLVNRKSVIELDPKPIGSGAVSDVYSGVMREPHATGGERIVSRVKKGERFSEDDCLRMAIREYNVPALASNYVAGQFTPDGIALREMLPMAHGIVRSSNDGKNVYHTIHRHEGETLESYAGRHIGADGRLTDQAAQQVLKSASNIAHMASYIAREHCLAITDLKPANVALGKDGQGVVIDLAISKVVSVDEARTKNKGSRFADITNKIGSDHEHTIRYASPELISRGRGAVEYWKTEPNGDPGDQRLLRNLDTVSSEKIADGVTSFGIAQTVINTLLPGQMNEAVMQAERSIKRFMVTEGLDPKKAPLREGLRALYHYSGGEKGLRGVSNEADVTHKYSALRKADPIRGSDGEANKTSVRAFNHRSNIEAIERNYGPKLAKLLDRAIHGDIKYRPTCSELALGLRDACQHLESPVKDATTRKMIAQRVNMIVNQDSANIAGLKR